MMEEVAHSVIPEVGNPIKAAYAAPVKIASTAEYGRIVIFKKGKLCHNVLYYHRCPSFMTSLKRCDHPTSIDGSEAAIFGLTGEIKIGRDRNSDIRIKIPSVSRNHARIYQDENGNVS